VQSAAAICGKRPAGRSGKRRTRRNGLYGRDETITFTVDDSTIVTAQSGSETVAAAFSDIAAGDILSVTLSDDNVAETIVIQHPARRMQRHSRAGSPVRLWRRSTVANGTSANTIIRMRP
jgi:hypothetical protein